MTEIGGLELAEMIASQTLHLPNRKAWREIGSKLGGRNLTSDEWLSLRREAWAARKRRRRQSHSPMSEQIGVLRQEIERLWKTLLDPQTGRRTWQQAAHALDAAFAELTGIAEFRDALMATADGLDD